MNPPANRRILIADDNAAIHEDFRKILAPEQFEIECALQGVEAFEKVKHAAKEGRPFAMAFVDVRMPPGWDGIETVAHFWKVDPELHVAFCTAYSDYSWEKITAQLGANDRLVILKKPFDHIEVLQLARTLTSKWSTTDAVHRQAADLDRRIAQRTQHLREANEELRRSEERFAKAFHGIPAGLAILALNGGCFIDMNAAFAEMTDIPRDEIIGRTPAEAGVPLDFPPAILEAVRAGRTGQRMETRIGEHRAIVSCERIAFGGEPHLLLLAQEISMSPEPMIGARTILVAEDDAAVRSHVKELLVHHEYRVLEAANAGAAMEIWRDQRESIDLLLTDMVMPGTDNGLDLARQFLGESPDLKVIYTSGYGVERFANDVELEEGRNYLPKPYLSYQLIDVLRTALSHDLPA